MTARRWRRRFRPRTLSYHHGKHHKAYIDKTNAAIEGTPHEGKKLTEIIKAGAQERSGPVQQLGAKLESRLLLALALARCEEP